MSAYTIDPDVAVARTLPGAAYSDPDFYAWQRTHLLPSTWQLLCWDAEQAGDANAIPLRLLPGSLDVPLLVVRDGAQWRCLSNVCTHRGAVLLEAPARCKTIRCPYHGRSFDLGGRFQAMPAFDKARDFPTASDDLPALPISWFGPLPFVSLAPAQPFAAWSRALDTHLGWVPWDLLRFSPARSRDYDLAANWMLYVDNYLEGLHIPFVHPALNRALDLGAYRVEVGEDSVLQVGLAAPGQAAFDLPAGHPDFGQRVAAYYLWLFPNLMLNLYPWGLSLNLIEPVGVERCRVRYRTWVWDEALIDAGAGADTHQTELEDHSVILRAQRGLRSPLYQRGRYAPTAERGLHLFHRLLCDQAR